VVASPALFWSIKEDAEKSFHPFELKLLNGMKTVLCRIVCAADLNCLDDLEQRHTILEMGYQLTVIIFLFAQLSAYCEPKNSKKNANETLSRPLKAQRNMRGSLGVHARNH
jgi:hypothetical protein